MPSSALAQLVQLVMQRMTVPPLMAGCAVYPRSVDLVVAVGREQRQPSRQGFGRRGVEHVEAGDAPDQPHTVVVASHKLTQQLSRSSKWNVVRLSVKLRVLPAVYVPVVCNCSGGVTVEQQRAPYKAYTF